MTRLQPEQTGGERVALRCEPILRDVGISAPPRRDGDGPAIKLQAGFLEARHKGVKGMDANALSVEAMDAAASEEGRKAAVLLGAGLERLHSAPSRSSARSSPASQ